jgi:hypothetical protein
VEFIFERADGRARISRTDSIEFRRLKTTHWFGDGVDICVNGHPLAELVRTIELSFAKAETGADFRRRHAVRGP